ncbi:(2Fe-2S)-binding protein [Mycobacterium sp. NPDC050041]|uniref:(2Fe-2S)-binding protein n=1 Tax=Mycobacterium sp. NPDC050041 TaxID=3364293 RepID=UPI003C2AD69E
MNITSALADISSYGMFFTIAVGDGNVDAQNWRPIADCYRDGCADLVDLTVTRYHTDDRRVGSSLVHLGHAARLWSPVLACVVAHGVLPDLTSLQRARHGPQLRLTDPVGESAGAPGFSPGRLYDAVVDGQLSRLAAGMPVGLAPGLLRGNIASALVGSAAALAAARPDLRRPVVGLTAALLDSTPLAGSGRFSPVDMTFRRRSCCLFYRAPAGSMCGDCSLRG